MYSIRLKLSGCAMLQMFTMRHMENKKALDLLGRMHVYMKCRTQVHVCMSILSEPRVHAAKACLAPKGDVYYREQTARYTPHQRTLQINESGHLNKAGDHGSRQSPRIVSTLRLGVALGMHPTKDLLWGIITGTFRT